VRADASEVSGHELVELATLPLDDVAFESHRAALRALRDRG
jgi:hypothetical protein